LTLEKPEEDAGGGVVVWSDWLGAGVLSVGVVELAEAVEVVSVLVVWGVGVLLGGVSKMSAELFAPFSWVVKNVV
jgi:hypothetical protein